MKKYLRLVLVAAAVVGVAVLAAGCGSKKSSSGTTDDSSSGSNLRHRIVGSYDNGKPRRAAPTRVGIEQSFGFTNNFDPTGEYLGNAWGIYDEPAAPHARRVQARRPARKATSSIGDLATDVPTPDRQRADLHVQAAHGVKFGPPVNRAVTSKDVAYAMQRLANPNDGGQYAFYYTVIKGWDAVRERQGEDDLGHLDARQQARSSST